MKFDIVTPSFNQGKYLAETIESVLSQEDDVVTVLYYIMDGGSTDGSIDIIKSFKNKLAFWCSEKDEGQSAAIHTGLAMGNGDIVTWINSDDLYPPGVFKNVAEYFSTHPEVDVLYGDCLMVDERSNPVGLGTHVPVSWEDLFETPYLINQESTFVRRSVYEKAGGVDPSFWGAMDYDLWLRIFYKSRPHYLPKPLGIHRFLPNQKSSSSKQYIKEMKRAREKLAYKYSLKLPSWPYSEKGLKRLESKWGNLWHPILQWIQDGCLEKDFSCDIKDIWKRYAQNGVLSVQGGTSFGWIGPNAIYIIDSEITGKTIEWLFVSPSPGLSASRVTLDIEDRVSWIQLNSARPYKIELNKDKRFSTVQIKADKSFIPALENWGPAYFNISLSSHPMPRGKNILSVQSIPCLPELKVFL